MRRFVVHALAFASIQLAIAVLVGASYRVDKNAYAASFIDKHDWLERVPSPRLILVGGSNLSFSNDSVLLEDRLGLHPVNLGIQGAMGLRFMLREAENAMRAGDVVVLSLEYSHYLERVEEPLSLFSLLEQDRRAFGAIDLDWPLFKLFADRSHLYARNVLRSVVNSAMHGDERALPPYTRDSFNRYGDVVAHWSMPTRGFEIVRQPEGKLDAGIVADLAAFALACRARGVRPFVFHPAIPLKKLETMKLEPLQRDLDRQLAIPQLNRIAEMGYPDDQFFDTVYHMTKAGTERRTALLAERLSQALNRSTVAAP